MMVDQNTAIEQLWYTWSDVGLDTIRAGFRIRAASEGLQEYRSLRVQDLDRYQRYALPPDVNPVVIALNMAPICLSLIDTGQERILVHKAYAGRDGVGRYGSFFIHLLAGLPEEFSAMDAISFWKSPFWQDSDVTLEDRRSTSLDRVSLQDLKEKRKKIPFDPQSVAKIREYLPYVIQAHLAKKPLIDEKTMQTVPQKLYIAAPDDDIARLILGLTSCLPEQLLKGLTFSTYEHDLTEATTEIVGTCWLSVAGAERDPHGAGLLPANYYTERLAVNCYTGVRSRLENNPLVSNKLLADRCAQDATEYFLQGSTEFKDLLDTVRYYPNLDVDEFLNLYESMIVRAENPSDSNMDAVLNPRTHANLAYTEKMLLRPGYQTALINRAIRDPKWWWTSGRAAIIRLREQSAERPVLAQALSQIARRAIPWVVNNAREGVPLAGSATPRKVITNEEATFTLIVDLMVCATPPSADPAVWILLLQELLTINDVLVFLNNYLDMQGYHPFIEDLFQQLLQDPQQWSVAGNLFDTLAAGKYRNKLSLLFILLDSPMGQYKDNAHRLLWKAALTTEEKAYFLEHYGPKYLPLANKLSLTVLDIFSELAKHDVHQGKMRVLFNWLASPQLSTWLDSSAQGEKNLGAILVAAHLNVEESGEFFIRYGQKYFTLYPRSSILWQLFGGYAASGAQPRLPFIWLNPQVDLETFERGLRTAHLTLDEKIMFLENSDERDIPRYQQSQMLLNYVGEYLQRLRTADIDIFKRSTSREEPSPTEKFLLFLLNPSLQLPSQQLIYDWHVVGKFLRKPSLLKEQPAGVATSIGRLLREQHIPHETHEKLMRELAVACLEDENSLSSVINTMYGVLTPPDLLLMLYEIAENAGRGIRERRYAETLFVSSIQLALRFKTVFYEEAAQKHFVQIFLDTLLLNADKRTFNWLNNRAKKWPFEAYAEWQKYEPRYLSPPAVLEPSRVERMNLWWERKVAFAHMWRALRSRRAEKIVQVDMDYMTTLNSYHIEVPGDWWRRIDGALHGLNADEDAIWKQYESQGNLKPPQAEKPPRFGRIKLWWKRTVAFRQMWKALRSKKIGKIVRIATDHMIMLNMHYEKVPFEWWWQMDAAFDFFFAFEEADESANEIREEAIISASSKIDVLVNSGIPAPKLTMHEKRRNEAAKQYVAYLYTQRMKAAMLSLSTARIGQKMTLIPHTKKPKQGFLNWFKRRPKGS